MGLFANQPFKAAYIIGALAFELARLPIWIASFIFPSHRQNPKYSFRQALGVQIFYRAVYHLSKIESKTPLPHTPGKEKERFVLLKAAASSYYKGALQSQDSTPVDIGATWYPAPLTASSDLDNVTVILHFHGGAYVLGDGRTEATGFGAKSLLKNTPATHVLAPQYRLSTLPVSKTSNAFPAAIQDCVTSYLYLVNTLKVSPRNIILSGDSAGGNAAISVLRYISEFGADLGIPTPSGALLWSPWVDPFTSATSDWPQTNPNVKSDYLSSAFTYWGTMAYAGAGGNSALSNPYISHLNRPFKTKASLFVNAGSAEVLYFDDKKWADDMKEAGNDVTWDVEQDVPHDILLLGNILGFEEAVTRQTKRAGEWISRLRK